MKNQLHIVKTCLLGLLVTFLFSGKAFAQTGGCLVSSLSLNTGVDPAAGSLIAAHGSDPQWQIKGLSPDNLAFVPAATFPFQAYVISPIYLFVTSTTSGWISFLDTADCATVPSGYYTDTLTRCFTVCEDDNFAIDIDIACDDGIHGIYVDGVSIYGGQPPAPNTPNLSTFMTVPTATVFLTSGEHCLEVATMNYPWPSTANNWHGLNVNGTISSVTGLSTLVAETAGCETFVCGGDPNPGDTTTVSLSADPFRGGLRVYPNPAQSSLYISGLNYATSAVPYSLLSITGSIAQSGILSVHNGSSEIAIRDLPGGIYILRLTADDKHIIHRRVTIEK